MKTLPNTLVNWTGLSATSVRCHTDNESVKPFAARDIVGDRLEIPHISQPIMVWRERARLVPGTLPAPSNMAFNPNQ
jgi:hypothetical protein